MSTARASSVNAPTSSGRSRSGTGAHGPAGTCSTRKPGFDLDERRLLGVLGAREHVDRDAGPRQCRRQRADVDVHAAAVAGARLCERRGVHAQHGHPLHSADDPIGAVGDRFQRCRFGGEVSAAGSRATCRCDRSPRTARAAGRRPRARAPAGRRSPPRARSSLRVGRLASTPSKRSKSGAHSESCSGRHLQRQPARRRVPARPGVGEDLRQPADEVLERPTARAAFDLGLEDVDAGLGEAPHVRDLGLELQALGVLDAELLDAAAVERRRGTRDRGRVRCGRVRRPCLPRDSVAHAFPLVVLTVPSDLAAGGVCCAVLRMEASAQHPAALSAGYGSVVFPLSPPTRSSKWRCGAVALPVMPVRPMTSPWATVRLSPMYCEKWA